MRYLCKQTTMQQLDEMTIREIGITSAVLMERAALAVFEEITGRMPCRTCLLLVGAGNNGGDGLALARLLYEAGRRVTVVLVGDHRRSAEGTRQLDSIRALIKRQAETQGEGMVHTGTITLVSGKTWDAVRELLLCDWEVVVDCLFGIGVSRPLVSPEKEWIEAVNRLETYRVAVDIPSGLACDTGQVMGVAVKADLTVTFGYEKLGMYCGEGPDVTGEVVVRDIGFLDIVLSGLKPDAYTRGKDAFSLLPKRSHTSNKGTYGRVSVIAGNETIAGAAYFCAAAAYRTGAGLVKVYSHSANREILLSKLPEAMFAGYDTMEDAAAVVAAAAEYGDVLVIGPGIGQDAFAEALVYEAVMQQAVPVVVDADALNILARHREWLEKAGTGMIITPHAKEMERLCGVPVADLRYQTVEQAAAFAGRYRLVCVLKGANTVVADGKNPAYVNTTGNHGMSTGGCGDVLAGVIAALVAAGEDIQTAAVAGVYVHGLAGELASRHTSRRALLASDVLDGLADVFFMAEQAEDE